MSDDIFKNLLEDRMGNNKKAEEIARLWTRSQSVVAAFIYSVVSNFPDTDDILQAVAVTIVRKYDSYDKKTPFSAWAIGIAKYEILNYRKKRARDKHIFDDELVNRIAETYQKTSRELEKAKNALEKCLSELKGQGKRILEMRYTHNMNAIQIAERLGVSRDSIYLVLCRLRRVLRECIDRHLKLSET